MKYILKRLWFYIIAFFGALALNFFLPRLMPGNPVQMFLSQLYKSGSVIDPAAIHAVEKLFGYDKNTNLLMSFFNYVVNVFKGNWGVSFVYFPETVFQALSRCARWTIFLMGSALVIGFIINSLLGILVAWRRGSRMDISLTVGGQILANIPSVVVALTLSITLAYSGLFPRGYAVTPLFEPQNAFEYLRDVYYHGFLPILSVVIAGLGGIMGMRANMINQLGEDYIVMGIAKGVPDRKIMFGYGARNALLPVVTSLAMQIGFLLGGSLIIEYVFNYPGLGQIMVQAINRRDYPLMQGILLMTTILMLVANFIADLSVFFLDPRTRRQGVDGN